MLAHGNCSEEVSRELAASLRSLEGRALHGSERSPQRCLQLPPAREVWLRQHPKHGTALQKQFANLEDTNSAVELFLQVEEHPGGLQ